MTAGRLSVFIQAACLLGMELTEKEIKTTAEQEFLIRLDDVVDDVGYYCVECRLRAAVSKGKCERCC